MTDEVIDFIMALMVSFTAWFFGGRDGYLTILIALIIIDYITGTCVAWMKGEISSRVGFHGIARKCIILTFVGIANLLDMYLFKEVIGGGSLARSTVCLFYIGNEGYSVIENADKLNIPIPNMLRKRFLNMKDSNDEEATKDESKNAE